MHAVLGAEPVQEDEAWLPLGSWKTFSDLCAGTAHLDEQSDMLSLHAGIAHLMGSLNREAQDSGSPVRVHCLSPGMVLTDLLLAGATARNKQVCWENASSVWLGTHQFARIAKIENIAGFCRAGLICHAVVEPAPWQGQLAHGATWACTLCTLDPYMSVLF